MDDVLTVLILPLYSENPKIMYLTEEKACLLAHQFPYIIHMIVEISSDI